MIRDYEDDKSINSFSTNSTTIWHHKHHGSRESKRGIYQCTNRGATKIGSWVRRYKIVLFIGLPFNKVKNYNIKGVNLI